jgi:hypothetical protein
MVLYFQKRSVKEVSMIIDLIILRRRYMFTQRSFHDVLSWKSQVKIV